jgi:hypothetical protein
MAAYLVGQVVLSSRENHRGNQTRRPEGTGEAWRKGRHEKVRQENSQQVGEQRRTLTGGSKVKVYCIANRSGDQLLETLFSTRERAEVELRDDELGEKDGYFIVERHISERSITGC